MLPTRILSHADAGFATPRVSPGCRAETDPVSPDLRGLGKETDDPGGDHFALILLEEMACSGDDLSSPAPGMWAAIRSAARGEKIGSESENRTSAGRSQWSSFSRTSSVCGQVGMVGLGRHELREGEDAGFRLGDRPRRVVGVDDLVARVGWTAEIWTSCPGTISGADPAHECAEPEPLLGRRAAAPMPVFRITSLPTRSGLSTASRSPIGPPQSWTTTVTSRRSSSSTKPRDRAVVEVVGVVLDPGRLVGAAEAEVVGRDDARRPQAIAGIILR